MIKQLTEKTCKIKDALAQAETTLKALWEEVVAAMKKELLCQIGLQLESQNRKHLRY